MAEHVISVYAGWNKDKTIRSSCASGGIFFTLARIVIRQGGVAVGAAFDADLMVKHFIVDNEPNLEKLKRSKYVRSGIGGLFPAVREILEQGRTVLYSGTPCQITTLKQYLKHNYDNLLTCSFSCYGTPNVSVYEKYLNSLQERFQSRISSINFKDKRYGWDWYTTCVHFENGKEFCRFGGDSYRKLMGSGYSLPDQCLSCQYDFRNTGADLVLGDFYTVWKYLETKVPRDGVSCVIVKTGKGEELLQQAEDLQLIPIDRDAFLKEEIPKRRDYDMEKIALFRKILASGGYEAACREVGLEDTPLNLKTELKALRKKIL